MCSTNYLGKMELEDRKIRPFRMGGLSQDGGNYSNVRRALRGTVGQTVELPVASLRSTTD
jgi:hypothetical protein